MQKQVGEVTGGGYAMTTWEVIVIFQDEITIA